MVRIRHFGKKHFVLLSIILLLFIATSCVFSGPQGDAAYRARISKLHITITSNPSGADIIFHGKIIGKTPAKDIPIEVRYGNTGYGLIVSSGWDTVIPENEYIFLKKDGYKTAGGELEFNDLGRGKLGLETHHYHADLIKE